MTSTIAVSHLWKVFGPRPERVVGSPLADLPRPELRARTGCLVAVKDVSFEVAPGEVFVVMGLSGCGKSTLVRCLTRLIEPTSGDISIDGEAVRDMTARRLRELRRHRVAMVFQNFGLLPHRSVLDNVAYGLEIQGMGRAERHRRAGEMLTLVGLDGHEHQFPDHPDIVDWKNLNKYAELFKTSESKGKGQFLAGDPSYVSNDAALIKNLKLNYEIVFSGSEAAIIKAAQQASAQKKPLLFYFYEPQWLFAQEKYVRVQLPPYTTGCDADPKKVACDYPAYDLDKIVSKKFADTNSTAYQLIKNFQWTNDDQNLVSDYITNKGMTAEQAGEKWVNEHESTWKPWIPAGS